MPALHSEKSWLLSFISSIFTINFIIHTVSKSSLYNLIKFSRYGPSRGKIGAVKTIDSDEIVSLLPKRVQKFYKMDCTNIRRCI